MKCARCSAEVPSHSQFCLRCGTPINAQSGYRPQAPAYSTAPAPAPNNRGLIITVSVLAVAVVAILGFLLSGALTQKPGTTAPAGLVQVPAATAPGRLVESPGVSKSTPPIVAPPTPPAPDYSAINDYLKFVHQVEVTKQYMIKKELAEALKQYANLLGDQVRAVSDDNAGKEFLPNINRNPQNFSAEWNKLSQIFLQRTPPQGCVKLHDLYYQHLGSITGMFNKIHDATAQANSGQSGDAVNVLTGMMGTASAEADQTAAASDDELADICRTCKLEKTFKIATDAGASGSLLH